MCEPPIQSFIYICGVFLSNALQTMGERLAENAHDVWAKKTKLEMELRGKFLKIKMF